MARVTVGTRSAVTAPIVRTDRATRRDPAAGVEGTSPTLPADQLAQRADAQARPVDTTDPDAPEVAAEAEAAGLRTRRHRLDRPGKEAISIRLDADRLASFRHRRPDAFRLRGPDAFRHRGPDDQPKINRRRRERMDVMGRG